MKKIAVLTIFVLISGCSRATSIEKIQSIENRKGIEGLSCYQLRVMGDYYSGRGDRHFGPARDGYRSGSSSGALHEGAMNSNFNKADKYQRAYIMRNCTE